MLRWAVEVYDGPVAIRYPRGGDRNYAESAWDPSGKLGDQQLVTCHRQGRDVTILTYGTLLENMKAACQQTLWNGRWFLRGFTADGRPIGAIDAAEGKVHMESNTWAVASGAATREQGISCMDAVDEWLYTPYGLMLNAPSFTVPDDAVGFVTRVYPGIKENGAVFSHPNPWAWVAECRLGRGQRAMKFYDALLFFHLLGGFIVCFH